MLKNERNYLELSDFLDENRCSEEYLRHACLGQSLFWPLLTSKFSNEQIVKKFRPLLTTKPPIQYNYAEYVPHPTYFRINIYNYLNLITKKETIDLLPYYLLELKQLGKAWSDILFPLLASPVAVKEKQIKPSLDSLLSFHNKNPALLRALYPCVSRLLKQIGAKNFIPAFGFDSLAIVEHLDPSFLEYFPQNSVNHSNIAEFLGFHSLLTNDQVSKVFQSLFACGEPFPSNSKLFKEPNVLTLTNDSLYKRKHFFDLLFNKAQECLINENNTKFQTVTEYFSHIREWVVLSQFETIYPENPNYFEELSKMYYFEPINSSSTNSAFLTFVQNTASTLSGNQNSTEAPNLTTYSGTTASERTEFENKTLYFFERLRNDKEVVSKIKFLMGISLQQKDFIEKSIPLILRPVIHDKNSVNEELYEYLLSKMMYIVSDKDRFRDISFLYTLRLFTIIFDKEPHDINLLGGTDPDLTENSDKSEITDSNDKSQKPLIRIDCEKIAKYLTLIPDQTIIQDVVLDLFSLLFLDDVDFYLEDCQNLITTIIPYASKSILPSLSIAMTKMQISSHLGITRFKDCLFSAETYFLYCIKRKEFKLAEKIVENYPKLVRVSQIALQLNNFRNNLQIDLNQDIENYYKVEQFFSFSSKQIKCNDLHKYKQEVLEYIKNNAYKDFYIIDKVLKRRNDDILQPIESKDFFSQLTNEVNKSIEDKSIFKKDKRFIMTKNFTAFLSIYNQNEGKSIGDIISNADDEEALSVILGPNSIEHILASNNGEKLIPMLQKQHPIVAKALTIENEINQKKTENDEKFKKMFIFTKENEDSSHDNILLNINDKYNEDQVASALTFFVKERDVDKILDLFFLYPQICQNKSIINSLGIDLPLYIQIFPEKSSKYLEKCAKIGIKSTDIKEIIDDLLEKEGKIKLAKQLSKYYQMEKHYQEKIAQLSISDPQFIIKSSEGDLTLRYELFALLPNKAKTFELKQQVYGIDSNNTENIQEIARKYSNIDFDDELYNFILAQDEKHKKEKEQNTFLVNPNDRLLNSLQIFKEEFSEILWVSTLIPLISLFKSSKKVCPFLCNKILHQISKLRITSQNEEEETISILRKTLKIMKQIKFEVTQFDAFSYESQLSKIDTLVTVLSNRLFTRFSVEFNLNFFQENNFGTDIINKCSEYDINVITDVNSAWRCDSSFAALNLCEYSFILGDNKVCWDIIEKKKRFGGNMSREDLATVIRDLSFPILFNVVKKDTNIIQDEVNYHYISKNPSDNEKMEEEPDYVHEISVNLPYDRIKIVLSGEGIETVYKEQALALSDIIEAFCSLHEHIIFCSSNSMLNIAYSSWNKLPPTQRTVHFALKDIIYPSLSCGQSSWNKFLRSFTQTTDLKDFPLEGVISHLSHNRMYAALSSFFYHMRDYEKSSFARINLLQTRVNWSQKLNDAKFIVDSLMKEVNKRQSQKNEEKNKRPAVELPPMQKLYQEISRRNHKVIKDIDLMRYSVIAGLECSFVQMCIDEKIGFINVDLFNQIPADALKMATLALVNHRFNLCLGICDLYTDKTSKNESNSLLIMVIQNSIDQINDNGKRPQNIPLFLEQLSKKVDEKSYRRIVVPFVKCIYSRAADISTVPKFIMKHVKGISFQIEVMMQLDFCNEAIAYAQTKGTREDLLFIENSIRAKGNKELLSKVQKLTLRK